MIILTICNSKGGVGKTSLCANLGGFIADCGFKVLLVDSDPQMSLSNYFFVTDQQYCSNDARKNTNFTGNINKTTIPQLDILISDVNNLSNRNVHNTRIYLNGIQNSLRNLKEYDLVIIDTQGASNTQVDSAILSSDLLLSPIVPDVMSAREFLRGTARTIDRLRNTHGCSQLPHSLNGVIYRTRPTVDCRLITQQIKNLIREAPKICMLKTSVPDRTVYRDAATAQIPVHRYEKRRRRGISANETMRALAAELLPELKINFNISNN